MKKMKTKTITYLRTQHDIRYGACAIVEVNVQLIETDFLIDVRAQISMQQIAGHLFLN